jgi:hypothetical protein
VWRCAIATDRVSPRGGPPLHLGLTPTRWFDSLIGMFDGVAATSAAYAHLREARPFVAAVCRGRRRTLWGQCSGRLGPLGHVGRLQPNVGGRVLGEQRAGADVAAHHAHRAVAGLSHDRPLRGPAGGG